MWWLDEILWKLRNGWEKVFFILVRKRKKYFIFNKNIKYELFWAFNEIIKYIMSFLKINFCFYFFRAFKRIFDSSSKVQVAAGYPYYLYAPGSLDFKTPGIRNLYLKVLSFLFLNFFYLSCIQLVNSCFTNNLTNIRYELLRSMLEIFYMYCNQVYFRQNFYRILWNQIRFCSDKIN